MMVGSLENQSLNCALNFNPAALDLFVPCGNQINKIGDNRDCWLINPKAISKLHLRKYFFVGCLFAMCVRSGILMNLNLSPLCWKRLTGDTLSERDIF